MLAIKNVLVATDFSTCSDVALNYGRALAQQFGARLHLMHAVEPIALDAANAGGFVAALPQLQVSVEEAGRAQLEGLLTADDRRALHATTVLVSFASPAPAIVAYAETEQMDLIVVGTHGRTGLSHLLMGSVAEKVVRTAPCPVLTVRNPERDFIVVDADPHLATVST